MTLLLVEQLFSIELVNFPNLLYDNIFFVSFINIINKLFNKFLRVTVVVLECWAYLSLFVKFEQLDCREYYSLMSTDVPILH